MDELLVYYYRGTMEVDEELTWRKGKGGRKKQNKSRATFFLQEKRSRDFGRVTLT